MPDEKKKPFVLALSGPSLEKLDQLVAARGAGATRVSVLSAILDEKTVEVAAWNPEATTDPAPGG